MKFQLIFWLTLFRLCVGSVGLAQQGNHAHAEISQLIQQLDADSFHVREAASHSLVRIGELAGDALRKTMSQGSLEARYRAKGIFRKILGPGLVVYLPMQKNQYASTVIRHPDMKPAVDQSGRKDQAAEFPGKGYWIIPDTAALDTDDEFTIASWIKPTQITYTLWKGHRGRQDKPLYPWGHEQASWSGHFIACKWNSAGIHGDYIFAITPSGRLALSVSNSKPKFQSDALFTERTLEVGKWRHVSCSFDRGELKLYVDGKLHCKKQSTKIHHTNRKEYPKDDLYLGDFWLNPGVRKIRTITFTESWTSSAYLTENFPRRRFNESCG